MSQRQYELQRVPRRPLPGSPSSSVRSRSAPSKKARQSKYGPGPSLTVDSPSPDSSSQKTAVNSDATKTPPTETVYEAPPSPLSDRVDSEESNNSGNTGSTGGTTRTTQPAAVDDSWDERNAVVPRSNLTVLDVAALILNKMVGTGIFTTPGAVLVSTKSKGMSVALWTVGGIWTILFLCVYLEFGNALPFNGGELVYLDEIFRTPELFATVLFSGFFLTLGNSYGNSVQFAKHVLISADPNIAFAGELDPRLVRYVAISAVTLVCLIHYFSSKAGLFLNKLLAWYKTLLLVVVFAAGFLYSDKHGSQWNDKTEPTTGSTMEGLAAMVLIFYSYQGWENANYVAGEIRTLEGRTPSRTLKTGAFLAVGVVWLLYVLVTVAYYKVLDYATITNKQTDLGVALHFAPKVFGGSLGMKICMVISAFGNIVAVTYTSSKVKQTIAIQRILPFWRFLTKDDETPKGALVLHWISSILMISLCPVTADGYSFAIGLFTYGHIFFSVFVALGLYGLKSRMREQYANYRLTIFRWNWLLYTVPIIFALGNMLVLITAALEHHENKIPRFWWAVTIALILLGSFLYWGVMRITRVRVMWKGESTTIGEIIGFEVVIYNKGDKDIPVDVKDSIAEALAAKIDGSGRRVRLVTFGRTKELGTALTKTKDFLAKWLF